ncbi:MAG TPA: BON domain-containing protein [Gemmatimonadaceae bacterium]|nr:BON domain-containing protein [Gemmatimonadaceae bacterium]
MASNAKREALIAIGSVGLGASLMYIFDPGMGHPRRARLRRAVRRMGRRRLSDEAVEARVRLVLARSVSHPRAITVDVSQGRVVLSGSVIAREVDGLLRRVRRVRGVRGVRSSMDAHDWAADVPGLQGAAERPRRLAGWEVLGWRWPAGAGIVGGTALGALAVRGVRALR